MNSDDNEGRPKPTEGKDERETGASRKQVSQTDVPAYPLDEALRIPEALRDQYAKQPTKPIDVARALPMSPTSGSFKMLTGAAIAYGLTTGGARADKIALTDIGRRIVAPTEEGDDLRARREALLQPRVVREFLERYDGSPLPSAQIAKNVLEEMGVPPKATDRTLELILTGAESLGLIVEIKNKRYVRLDAGVPTGVSAVLAADVRTTAAITSPADAEEDEAYAPEDAPPIRQLAPVFQEPVSSKVFVTHGRNKEIVNQIKEILQFGKFEPVVSIEKETTAKPVSDKVLEDMRSCYAGIVHVGTEERLMDEEGSEHRIVNQNVLIEIGAAMALYGRRFVLLVERGVTLPSNLQGLYEVRYEGDRLDYEATMKLLRAFNEFRDSK
jgi:CAP12/Pycsar effector protein, TIR domain